MSSRVPLSASALQTAPAPQRKRGRPKADIEQVLVAARLPPSLYRRLCAHLKQLQTSAPEATLADALRSALRIGLR